MNGKFPATETKLLACLVVAIVLGLLLVRGLTASAEPDPQVQWQLVPCAQHPEAYGC